MAPTLSGWALVVRRAILFLVRGQLPDPLLVLMPAVVGADELFPDHSGAKTIFLPYAHVVDAVLPSEGGRRELGHLEFEQAEADFVAGIVGPVEHHDQGHAVFRPAEIKRLRESG